MMFNIVVNHTQWMFNELSHFFIYLLSFLYFFKEPKMVNLYTLSAKK